MLRSGLLFSDRVLLGRGLISLQVTEPGNDVHIGLVRCPTALCYDSGQG